MGMALEEADRAYKMDEVPIGALIVGPQGEVLSKECNFKEQNNDPCGHAEILAIRAATKKLGDWRLLNCTLYVTLEPCPMCLAAMVQARISRLVFAAYDSKGGALSLNYNLHKDQRLNHSFKVTGGIRHFECSALISSFFKEKRGKYNFKQH